MYWVVEKNLLAIWQILFYSTSQESATRSLPRRSSKATDRITTWREVIESSNITCGRQCAQKFQQTPIVSTLTLRLERQKHWELLISPGTELWPFKFNAIGTICLQCKVDLTGEHFRKHCYRPLNLWSFFCNFKFSFFKYTASCKFYLILKLYSLLLSRR